MDDAIHPPPSTPLPRLWNPAAAAWWSLLLSPAFGAWLHAANWRTLGDRQQARANMLVFWLTIVILAATLGMMFLPESKLLTQIDRATNTLGIALFVGWYIGVGRAQVRHVKELDNSYEKRGWGIPLLIGFTAVGGFCLAIFATAVLTSEPDASDAADDVRPMILEDWRSKPLLKDATIEKIVLDPKGHGVFRGFVDATFGGKPERLSLEVTYKGGTLSYKVTPSDDE